MSIDDMSVVYARDLTDQMEGAFEKVLKRVKIHTLDMPLVPITTLRFTLGISAPTFLYPNVEYDYKPGTTYYVLVNVESGNIRYSDSLDVSPSTGTSPLGEFYQTGATFTRYLQQIVGVNFCADSGTAIINVSLYHE